jgi:hypothetical protein
VMRPRTEARVIHSTRAASLMSAGAPVSWAPSPRKSRFSKSALPASG